MKVFTEVVETSKKTDVERYKSYDGKLFSDKKMCADYESALTKVNIIALTTSSNCKVINEYDLYNGYAGCEDYCYLVATVTESIKTPLKMVFRAFHHRSEVGDLEQLDFEKNLKEGSKLVFGVGCLGCYTDDTIDDFEDFHSYGTVEEFKKEFLKGFSLLDLD
jgi:hypothetical protein